LPGWARLRRKQMEEISGRLTLALPQSTPPDPVDMRESITTPPVATIVPQ
jgi:hypothetical protein